jgi:hypothetical protein
MRSLSLAARQAMFAQETTETFLFLLSISGVGLTEPLRFVNDAQDLVSRGNTYLAFPFQITLPTEGDDSPPSVVLQIDNVSQQIVAAVRSLVEAPTVTLEVVLASEPDEVEAGPFDFILRAAEYDALVVSGRLQFEDTLSEPYPADSFDPTRFQGLY